METQKSSRSLSFPSVKKAFRRFEDIKAEFVKIQWTEDGEVISYAKIVVIATFVSGMVLYVADLFVHRTLSGFDAILRAFFG